MVRGAGRWVVIDVHDWALTPGLGGGALVFRPSGRTIGRQLWLTALAAVVIGVIMYSLGVPPGARAVRQQRDRVAQLESQVERQSRHAARVKQSVVGSVSQATRQMAAHAEQQAGRMREELARERARLEGMSATLGPVGDAVYWGVIGLLILLGVGLPLSGRFERVVFLAGEGTLRIRTRLSLVRRRTLPAAGYVALAVQAQRLITTPRKHAPAADHGWLWRVLLLADPDDPHAPPSLEVRCDREDMLPPRIERMTPRTRQVVAFCQQATGLDPQPPITTEVKGIDRGALAQTVRMKSRRHGPAQGSPYQPLD